MRVREGVMGKRGAPASLGALAIAAAAILAMPAHAGAQENHPIGVGFRFSFVRSADEAVVETDRLRFNGAIFRGRLSPRTAVELSLDYHSQTDLVLRTRDIPVQGSLLLYPVRRVISPYLLGGVGWYTRRIDALADGAVLDGTKETRFGSHAGLGGELEIGRRVTVHLDYRYTFLGFGNDDETKAAGAVPIPGLIGLQDKAGLSHEGSMWTTGVTFYF